MQSALNMNSQWLDWTVTVHVNFLRFMMNIMKEFKFISLVVGD